jgi:hypothetical protein
MMFYSTPDLEQDIISVRYDTSLVGHPTMHTTLARLMVGKEDRPVIFSHPAAITVSLSGMSYP